MAKKSNLNKYQNRRNTERTPPVKNEINSNKEKIEKVEKKQKIKVVEKVSKIELSKNYSFWSKYSKFLPWIVLVITFLVFSNAINNDFVNWDDDRYVTGNQYLELNWTNIKYFFSNFYFVMYIPLTMLSYMIDYKLVGLEQPWVYHLHNVILHVITTGLVFIFIKNLFEKKGNKKFIYAAIVALLFGVHPLHVESVSWIAERKDVLYSLFFIASLISYLKYIKNKKILNLVIAFGFYLLSLFSKTQAVVLPMLMIATDYYHRSFITDKNQLVGFITFKDKEQWKIFLEKIPFLGLSIVFGLIAVKASGTNEPFAENFATDTKIAVDTGYGLLEKIMLMSYSLFLYVSEMIVPFKQSAIHPYPFDSGKMPGHFYVFSIFSLSFVALFIWAWIKKQKEILLGLMFFIFNLIIVLHIKNFIISEHYLYLPAIGISIILVFLALKILEKQKQAKNILIGFMVLYIGFLSYKTFERNKVFENSLTFWNDVTDKYPEVIVGYYNRGNYLQEQGDKVMSEDQQVALDYYNQAIEDYTKTVDLHKTNIGAFSNRGITLAKIGKYQEAIEDFNQVVQIDSTYGNVYSNRGNAWGLLGNWNNAISDYNKSLALKPGFEDALFNRGVAYANINKNRESVNDLSQVIRQNPNKIDAYFHRAISYYLLDKPDSAIADINIYLNIQPDRYNLIYYRALAYEKKGEVELAKQDFETLKNKYPQIISDLLATATRVETQADASRNIQLYNRCLELFNDVLKIDANSSVAYSRIGVIFGKMGDMNKAFSNLNKAISMDENNAQAYADRGYAHSILNNNAQAMQDYNKALELNPNDHSTYYNRGLLYETYGDFEKAIDDLNKSISIKSDLPVVYFRRGIILNKIGQTENACKDWQQALQLGLAEAQSYLDKYCN